MRNTYLENKLLQSGIQPNIPHYGYVETFYHGLMDGRGIIRAYLHYAEGKKWKNFLAKVENILDPNKFANYSYALRLGNLVEFLPMITAEGSLIATKIRIIAAETSEARIETLVQKCYTLGMFDGFPAMPPHEEILPKIKKAPRREAV